jgi:L-ascorbate metabolism protein UlaG (beta-lactamase superfamily)
VKITMIGHCTVLIETDGKRIITDPYFGQWGSLVYKRLAPPARTREGLKDVDLVLISHNHWDHIDRRYLRLLPSSVPVVAPKLTAWTTKLHGAKNVVGVNTWETKHFEKLTVTAVPALHITVAVGYVIQSEEKQIYFAGDTYYHPFMEKVGQRFQLDIALLPMTGYRIPMTMGEKGAVRAVEVLSPKAVIPIHQAIIPRLALMRTDHTPEGFQRRVQKAGLECSTIVLQEEQSWEF